LLDLSESYTVYNYGWFTIILYETHYFLLTCFHIYSKGLLCTMWRSVLQDYFMYDAL